MGKTVYKKPIIELLEIEKNDILTTSGGGNPGGGDYGGGGNPGGGDNSGGADIGPWDPIM